MTCTLVSFFHGSNDGQKGVGLIMLILIGIVPTFFALNDDLKPIGHARLPSPRRTSGAEVDANALSAEDRKTLVDIQTQTAALDNVLWVNQRARTAPERALRDS
ncbi:hypothetical protein [Hymenobacter radiodurans]|uniref:hypothetical protein n=1 Tax=Hymenobacter radiodurans TaxID=2496028 RepID=UPI0029390F7E|nr:hypothetical protein [Hymenobacter radiodurans]